LGHLLDLILLLFGSFEFDLLIGGLESSVSNLG